MHPVRAWDADIETAEVELEATGSQAFLVAVHALAWRSSMVLVPAAWIVVLLNAPADRMALALGVGTLIGLFGAQAIATFLTFPVAYFATGQTWFRGSRDARIRFGTTGLVYNYYGWRYAFRGRTRPWGALTHEEQVALNPARAGVPEGPPPRRNYWPE
jgi:hypothetical protein